MMLMLNLSIGSSPIATHTEPTTWDPSAREPTLPYPHIASLSLAFLFQAPGTIIDTPTC